MTTQFVTVISCRDVPGFDTRYFVGYTGDPSQAVDLYHKRTGVQPEIVYTTQKERLTLIPPITDVNQ
jgi:hypothetical protein